MFSFNSLRSKGLVVARPLLVALLVVLIVVAGGAAYWWHHHKYQTAGTAQIPTNNGVANANPNVPGTQSLSGNPATGATASKNAASNTPSGSLSPAVQPTSPTGDFVSNHRPSLSSQNTETSECITTPGAYCQIRFTSGSVTKSLPVQKTFADGSTSWSSWTLQSLGLTVGTWQITAVATNGDKTSTAQDALQLVVRP